MGSLRIKGARRGSSNICNERRNNVQYYKIKRNTSICHLKNRKGHYILRPANILHYVLLFSIPPRSPTIKFIQVWSGFVVCSETLVFRPRVQESINCPEEALQRAEDFARPYETLDTNGICLKWGHSEQVHSWTRSIVELLYEFPCPASVAQRHNVRLGIERSRVRNSLVPSGFSVRRGN